MTIKFNVYYRLVGSKYERYLLIDAMNQIDAKEKAKAILLKRNKKASFTKVEESKGFYI